MTVRPARAGDIDSIEVLLRDLHRSAGYGCRVDQGKARWMVARFIAHSDLFAWVSETRGQVGGVLLGGLEEPWYSRERYASDWVFHSRDGSGAALLRRFLAWAHDHGAVEVILGVSAGTGDPERIARLYARLGIPRVGSLHRRVLE